MGMLMLLGVGTVVFSPFLTPLAFSHRGEFNASAFQGTSVLVSSSINTADSLIIGSALTVLWQNGLAFLLVQDLVVLDALCSAGILIGSAVSSADWADFVAASSTESLGLIIQTSAVVSLLDVGAVQKALVVVGLSVETANGQVEISTLALLVAGAGTHLVELSLGAVQVASVVIGDSVLAANELGESGAVTAVGEVVRGALSLVQEGLSLALEDTVILEGFHISGANWLGNGGASTGSQASVLSSNSDISTKSDTLVLVGDVIGTTNRAEGILTSAWNSDAGSNVVDATTGSRANFGNSGSGFKVTQVLVGDSVVSADRVVDP
jgi:hypothetical protein